MQLKDNKGKWALDIEDTIIVEGSDHYDLTVIIPHYQAPKMCIQAIDSIFSESFSVEILVVDDGSSIQEYGKLLELCQEFTPKTKGLRIIRRDNSGAYLTRLWAVMKAKGDYIKFLDQDDSLLAGALDLELNKLASDPTQVLLTDWIEVERNEGNTTAQNILKSHHAPEYSNPILDFLIKGGVYTSAAIYARDILLKIEPVTGWKPKMNDDWVIFGQAVLQTPTYSTLHINSYAWRIHDAQLSHDKPIEHAIEFYQFLDYFQSQVSIKNICNSEYAKPLAKYYCKNAIALCWHDSSWWFRVANNIAKLDSRLNHSTYYNGLLNTLTKTIGLKYGVNLYVLFKRLFHPTAYSKLG